MAADTALPATAPAAAAATTAQNQPWTQRTSLQKRCIAKAL
jgi:hypothetical protein